MSMCLCHLWGDDQLCSYCTSKSTIHITSSNTTRARQSFLRRFPWPPSCVLGEIPPDKWTAGDSHPMSCNKMFMILKSFQDHPGLEIAELKILRSIIIRYIDHTQTASEMQSHRLGAPTQAHSHHARSK